MTKTLLLEGYFQYNGVIWIKTAYDFIKKVHSPIVDPELIVVVILLYILM